MRSESARSSVDSSARPTQRQARCSRSSSLASPGDLREPSREAAGDTLVHKAGFAQEFFWPKGDPEFLIEFPRQGLGLGLSGLQLAPGEFPESAQGPAKGPAGHEHLSSGQDDGRHRCIHARGRVPWETENGRAPLSCRLGPPRSCGRAESFRAASPRSWWPDRAPLPLARPCRPSIALQEEG